MAPGGGATLWEAPVQAGYVQKDSTLIASVAYDLNEDINRFYGIITGYTSSTSLLGWYRLNENVSTTGTITNYSRLAPVSISETTFDSLGERPAFRQLNGPSKYIQTSSCYFNGAGSADDAVNIGTAGQWDDLIGNDTSAGSTQKMSFAAWVYKIGDGQTNSGKIIDFGNQDILFDTSTTEGLFFSAKWNNSATGSVVWRTEEQNLFNLNEWAHVAVTYDANNVDNDPKMYVNGQEFKVIQTSGTKVGAYYGIVSQDAYIGNTSTKSKTWEGNLSDVAVWNSVLGSEEVLAIYKASKEPEGWINAPSKPWFTNYNAYKQDLKLMAKGYSIIPEYRISENVGKYLNEQQEQNPFQELELEIPHVANANTKDDDSFFISYSNSEFLKDFLNIKRESLLDANEIKLSVTGAIRFNPYKGFYPAQRTVDLVTQFKETYNDNFISKHTENFDRPAVAPTTPAGNSYNAPTTDSQGIFYAHGTGSSARQQSIRPVTQPLFAPGILYNTIKSGIAVDFPVFTPRDDRAMTIVDYTRAVGEDRYPPSSGSQINTFGANSRRTEVFDQRLPFETMLEPVKHIGGRTFTDMEANTQAACSASTTASFLDRTSDTVYEQMSRNFFGSVPSFFLKDSEFTSIKSDVKTETFSFKGDEVYMMRIKLNRSTEGTRTYAFERDWEGNNYASGGHYSPYGAKTSSFAVGTDEVSFALPQDPIYANSERTQAQRDEMFRETFTMYSRASAFGPPLSARPVSDPYSATAAVATSSQDSYIGINPAFTPPYTNGEAWTDVVFRPQANKEYKIEDIIGESKTKYWRFDPGAYNNNLAGEILIPNAGNPGAPYDGGNINNAAMQMSGCFNMFGVEKIVFTEDDKFGNQSVRPGQSVGQRWTIKPKFETPMFNFNKAAITYPENFGGPAAAKGMWHQFGAIPKKYEGVFLSVNDIPRNWLQLHYDVILSASVYNDYTASHIPGTHAGQPPALNLYKQVRSLADLVGFNKNINMKLGQLKTKQTIKEAIVAIPYITERTSEQGLAAGTQAAASKKFISIPKERYDAALQQAYGTKDGDSFDVAGASISKQLQKMKRFILPPQFDFLNNPERSVEPFVMYIFEFKYDLDRDDLSYIWQNLAPRNYEKIDFQQQSVAHELVDAEILNETILEENENLRWMIFKVKQKGQEDYWDYVDEQAKGSTRTGLRLQSDNSNKYVLRHNWPYDYISFVEMAKMNIEIKYSNQKLNTQQMSLNSSQGIPMSTTGAPTSNEFDTPSIADSAKFSAAKAAAPFIIVESVGDDTQQNSPSPGVTRATVKIDQGDDY